MAGEMDLLDWRLAGSLNAASIFKPSWVGTGEDKKPESLSGSFILPPDVKTRRQTHGMGIGEKGGRMGGSFRCLCKIDDTAL